MNWVASVLSVLALGLTAFNIYWTHLRKRKALYLLSIAEVPLDVVQFALINAGKSDLLITGLRCSFEHASGNGRSTPAQELSFRESDSFLLGAG